MDFSLFERERREVLTAPIAESFFLYGDAWKKFDRLQAAASGTGLLGRMVWAVDLLLATVGWLGLHVGKHYLLLIFVGWVLIRVLQLLHIREKKKQFLHWPCPRCHAEWPGSKTQKDSKCKLCGLRLHQLSP
ncbi:MAG: hypothetical protein ACRD5R_08130 [Candidatus Acidiferrales bacterium]